LGTLNPIIIDYTPPMTMPMTSAAPLPARDEDAAAEGAADAGDVAAEPVRRHDEREIGFMRRALAAAEEAAGRGEVPVGAVVTLDGEIVAVAHNERETGSDPTAHAEIVALRRAAAAIGNWRLCNADLYVTMEPCPMCAGALVNARIRRLYFGCDDPKAGAVRTLYKILDDRRLNHRVDVVPGLMAAEGAALLRSFFGRLRR
jgi:tRNA(adenine34) deaminase